MSPNNLLFRSTAVDGTTPQETFRYLNEYGNPMEAFYFILIFSKPKRANIKATLSTPMRISLSNTRHHSPPVPYMREGFIVLTRLVTETAPHIRSDSLTEEKQSTENLVTTKCWCSEPKLLPNRHGICSHPDRSMNVLGA